jgi:hypothetical protein
MEGINDATLTPIEYIQLAVDLDALAAADRELGVFDLYGVVAFYLIQVETTIQVW